MTPLKKSKLRMSIVKQDKNAAAALRFSSICRFRGTKRIKSRGKHFYLRKLCSECLSANKNLPLQRTWYRKCPLRGIENVPSEVIKNVVGRPTLALGSPFQNYPVKDSFETPFFSMQYWVRFRPPPR